MIDFKKELENILENDPLGLLESKAKVSTKITADERLIESFEEINSFVQTHNREPSQSSDINERRLYSRLKGLRENPGKAIALLKYDFYKLLEGIEVPESKEINTIEDVLGDDILGLLADDQDDIFALKNVPKPAEKPDYIAKRKTCNEFEQFEPLFKKIHAELSSKKKVTKPFSRESQIATGEFFILQGMLVYVANVGKKEKINFGNFNARLFCVFENGTESNMQLRSLAAAFWKDENSRHVVDPDPIDEFNKKKEISSEDCATGYIYVLRSLSNNPQIKKFDNLYKIGFSSKPIQRIQNAENEPTYLMADVMPVTEFQTYNFDPQKMELLLHRFFAESCLNIDVYDNDGNRHTPREWFVVPLHIIETAVELLISGDIVHYRYDNQNNEIQPR